MHLRAGAPTVVTGPTIVGTNLGVTTCVTVHCKLSGETDVYLRFAQAIAVRFRVARATDGSDVGLGECGHA